MLILLAISQMVQIFHIKAKKNAENICKGYVIEDDKLDAYLQKEVREIIFDLKGTEQLIEELDSTDFSSDQLKDLFSLESQTDLLKNFRIGEALVEILLKEHFEVVFYWNSVRDEANPKANRTGVDIIGIQKRKGKLNFAFVEVKTSYDENSPPSVVYSLTKQIEDLVNVGSTPRNAIRTLAFKAKSHGFEEPFKKAVNEFLKKRYSVVGGLVRDTKPNELDVQNRFLQLDNDTPADIHVQMYTFYFKNRIEKWPSMVMEKEEGDAE